MLVSYVHPVLAALVLGLLGYVASLGVRARNDRRNRKMWLARHARIAPWMFAGVFLSSVGGLVGTWLTRPADELATSWHFRLGVLLVAVLSMSLTSSRWMDRAAVRAAHPWFGAFALLLAAGQFFFGLQMLP